MMAVAERLVTAAEFDEWVLLPENSGRDFELVGGRIVEVVSNNQSSGVGALLGGLVTVFVHQRKLGFTTGADGGYKIGSERYIPDVAFVSIARQLQRTRDAFFPLAPDLAIEVLYPANTPDEIRIKIANYLSVGTIVWVVDPDLERIEVYAPGTAAKVYKVGETLDGGEVLPGFSVTVAEVFGA
jgi:Uma2 family endonuclease